MRSEQLTGEGGVVVLVLLTDAGKVADNGDIELLQELGVADTRALKNLHRSRLSSCLP